LIAAVVLAAGLSRRMGRPKLLLDLCGRPVIRHTVEALVDRVGDVVVVSGGDHAVLDEALSGLPVRVVVNSRPEDGQGSSIAVGFRALRPGTRAAFVVLGDQPRLPGAVIPALLEAFTRSGKPIIAPVYAGGAQGNPVLFGREVFPELITLTGDAGGKSLLQARPERVEHVVFDLPMPPDLDTPDDHARLQITNGWSSRGEEQCGCG
jgi:molybdenum cofactor cytidylyltransferase